MIALEELCKLGEDALRLKIEGFKRNELQKIAKQCGVKANGRNEVLIDSIINHLLDALSKQPKEASTQKPTIQKRVSIAKNIDNGLSPVPNASEAVYHVDVATTLKVGPNDAKLQSTPINPLYLNGRRNSRASASTSESGEGTKRRLSTDWAAKQQAQLAMMQEQLQTLKSVQPKATVSKRLMGDSARKQAPLSTKTNTITTNNTNNAAPLPKMRRLPPLKPATKRPAHTASHQTLHRTVAAGVAKKKAATTTTTARPASAVKPSKPAAPKVAGPNLSDRAQKAAEKFAERMKKAQAARMGAAKLA